MRKKAGSHWRTWRNTSELDMNVLYLSPEAQADLEEVKAYIAEELENPGAALATISRVTKKQFHKE